MSGFPRFTIENQAALVTGAARGLGRSIALALAAAGADVALGLRDAATGADLADEIQALGRQVLRLQMDVTDRAQVQRAVDRAIDELGRIDILVNNAGLGPENPAERVTEADFDLTCAVNLKGTFFVSQAVGKTMIARGSGRIINLS